MTHRPWRSFWTARTIIAVIVGFMIWWPLGIAVLVWIHRRTDFEGILRDEFAALRDRFDALRERRLARDDRGGGSPSRHEADRHATDEDTRAFTEFVGRLRRARKVRDFDASINERGKA